MTFARNLIQDLVEKRLWPVALLLCAALVAVPVVLKREAPAPVASSPSGGDAATAAHAVALGETGRSRLDVGSERDPFGSFPARRQGDEGGGDSGGAQSPSGSGDAAGGGDSAAGGDPGAGGDTGGDGGGGATGGGGSGDSGSPGTTPIPDPPEPGEMAWTLDVRFGRNGSLRRMGALVPGRALPSADEPVIVYLGAEDNGRAARFLISSDARPQGDGRCEPDRRTCTELVLREGDTTFLDVARGDETLQYELELQGIVRRRVE